jgi:hypothetical protein
VPKQGLVAVLSAAPRRTKAKAGTSWLGSPPTKLRRATDVGDQTRTYHPPMRLRLARGAVELLRVVPVLTFFALCLIAVTVLQLLAATLGWFATALLSGVVLIAVGALAAAVTTGTPGLNAWLRSMGARVGKGVWCETYWLPEADLVDLQDGVTVNEGCVVQTHLFHDRVLSLDTVTLRAGATLGPHSVILPAAVLGRHATVGPVSLVMRGEVVPDKTRWMGNPIGPWVDEVSR